MPQPNVVKSLIGRDVFLTDFTLLGASLSGAAPYTMKADIDQEWNILEWNIVFSNLATLQTLMQARLIVNNEVVRRWVATDNTIGFDLDIQNQYDKIPAYSSTGSILCLSMLRNMLRGGTDVIEFGLPISNDQYRLGPLERVPSFISGSPKDGTYETSLNCGSQDPVTGLKINNVRIELDFSSTGATPPSASLYARVLPPVSGGPGALLRTEYQSLNAVSGNNTLNKSNGMPLGNPLFQLLNRIYLMTPNGVTLDQFQMQYNTQNWITRTAARNQFIQARWQQRTSGATLYVLDFQEEGWTDTPLEVWKADQSLNLQFTSSDAVGVGVYYEFIGAVSPAR